MGSFALTAPESMGWAKGSTLYVGAVVGFTDNENSSDDEANTQSYYVGGTLATPVAGLKLGAAFDAVKINKVSGYTWAVGGYASYKATEKLSLHARLEYVDDHDLGLLMDSSGNNPYSKIFAATATVQYDLWKNVISRLEFRWDHGASGFNIFGRDVFSGSGNGSFSGLDRRNAYMLAANVIYKF